MKIIQSFWSKPSFHSVQNYNNARKFGGWLNFNYFLISTALSCLTIRKQQKQIELYTDDNGKGLFIDLMDLPFDDVSVALNELQGEDHKLWILGKMKAIEMQTEPFIHMDNDIYLWEQLPVNHSRDFLITQSRFPIWPEYKASLNEIFANFSYIPECLQERPSESTMVSNVGIIGGNDIDFFQEFCATSAQLVNRNLERIPLLNDIGGFNQMIEEYLFTSMVRFEGRKMHYYMESHHHPLFPPSHLHFNLVPVIYKYIHLIGKNKQDRFACEQLKLRLKYEFPEEYKKIKKVIEGLNEEESRENFTARQDKLVNAMNVFYNYSFEKIANLKIQFIPGIEVIRVQDYLGDEVTYLIREEGKTDLLKSLPSFAFESAATWLHLFNKPISINELLEEIQKQHHSRSEQEKRLENFELINTLTGNILLLGIMEFAE